MIRKLIIVFLAMFIFLGCINLDVEKGLNGENNKTTGPKTETNTSIKIGPEINGTITGHRSDDKIYVNGTYLYTPNSILSVYFIDTKIRYMQGDAIFIKKGEFEMLIDCGSKESEKHVMDFISGKISGDLEVIIITHDDNEHWGGLSAILEKYKVNEIWWNGIYDSDEYYQLLQIATEQGVFLRTVEKDDFFDVNGADLKILNPSKEKFPSADTSAIISRLEYDKTCILFLSDSVYGSQANIINAYGNLLACEIMQVPYSGLGTGNANLNILLSYVEPKYAVMTGDLNIKNPSNPVLRDPTYQQLAWANTTVYETFEGGTVKITSNGPEYSIGYQ
ncbi:MAG: MBL fold metallo-hydrolase [Candidatus Micrarchaeia archaeon]